MFHLTHPKEINQDPVLLLQKAQIVFLFENMMFRFLRNFVIIKYMHHRFENLFDKKDCIVQESDLGRPRGRQAFYHHKKEGDEVFLTVDFSISFHS